MKSILIALIIAGVGFSQISHNMDARYIGPVTEVKLLNMDNQYNVYIWVRANKEYVIKGVNHIPNIYVGDSLFEYWTDYQKIGVGTRRNLVIYEIKR